MTIIIIIKGEGEDFLVTCLTFKKSASENTINVPDKFPRIDMYPNYKWFLIQRSNANDSKFFAKRTNICEQVQATLRSLS